MTEYFVFLRCLVDSVCLMNFNVLRIESDYELYNSAQIFCVCFFFYSLFYNHVLSYLVITSKERASYAELYFCIL